MRDLGLSYPAPVPLPGLVRRVWRGVMVVVVYAGCWRGGAAFAFRGAAMLSCHVAPGGSAPRRLLVGPFARAQWARADSFCPQGVQWRAGHCQRCHAAPVSSLRVRVRVPPQTLKCTCTTTQHAASRGKGSRGLRPPPRTMPAAICARVPGIQAGPGPPPCQGFAARPSGCLRGSGALRLSGATGGHPGAALIGRACPLPLWF